MLLNPRLADAYKAVRPRLAPDGREVQMEVDQLAGQLSKQSAARSFEVDAGGAELASLSTKPGRSTALESSQNGFARLVEEAGEPDLGRVVKEELIRTASAPSELPLCPEPPILLQNSGLDWSGSVDGGATLIRLSQELEQGATGEADTTDGKASTIAFPPRERYRQLSHPPSMSRLSEDCAQSSTLSDGGVPREGLSASAEEKSEGASTPATVPLSPVAAHADAPFESPFEASQFQEEPIARPAQLPEVAKDEIARSAATVPPSQLDSMLTPSTALERTPCDSPAAAESPSRRSQLDETQRPPTAPAANEASTADAARRPDSICLAQMQDGWRRQTGMKSLSVLERDGIPVLQDAATVKSQEVNILSLLRQKFAGEAAAAVMNAGASGQEGSAESGGQPLQNRSQTAPTAELLQIVETAKQALANSSGRLALPLFRQDLSTDTILEGEDDMLGSRSLQQAILDFNPVEDASRSPTRAPSLFDLAAPHLSGEGSEWIIRDDEIELGRCIGSGSFGDVYRAQWKHTDVAVKRLNNVSEGILTDFKQEVALMAKLKHPNVVQFLGATVAYPHLSIVTQFMPRGSLFNLIHRAKVRLDDKQKLWMALDCAKGLHYLHSCRPPIVHGDVSSKNMLVDRDFSIRVADFGMSRQRRKAMLSAKADGQGTAEWTAPEVLRGLPYGESCDVYSFGVILHELMTQEVPWGELSTIQVVGAVGWGNGSLSIPDSISLPIRDLMAACMQRDPQKRPTFDDVIVALRSIRQQPSLELHAAKPVGTTREAAQNETGSSQDLDRTCPAAKASSM